MTGKHRQQVNRCEIGDIFHPSRAFLAVTATDKSLILRAARPNMDFQFA